MRSRLVIATFSVAAMLWGCATQQQATPPAPPQQPAPPVTTVEPLPPPLPEGPIRVGLLLPLTGNAAAVGADMLDAAQLALFDVGDNDLVLLPRDTSDTTEGATAAARDALDNGAQLLLGPLFSSATVAVAPLAVGRNVRVLSFSNDAAAAGKGAYIMGFRPEEQVDRVVRFAHGQGLTRVAALAPDDAYGARALRAWRAASTGMPGIQPGPSATYQADGIGASDVVARLTGSAPREAASADQRQALVSRTDAAGRLAMQRAAGTAGSQQPPFDALLLPDSGTRLQTILGLLESYGVDPRQTRLLGTMLWQDDPTIASEPRLEGAWMATVTPDGVQAFARHFEDTFGRKPGPLAGLAYDVTALAAVLARSERRFDDTALTAPAGFAGRLGIFRLMPNGLTEHGLAVVEVGPGGGRLLDPAPNAFDPGLASAY